MEISIIVPVYKVEKYIRECMVSLVNQTFKDIEIIVVDDGSPDNSASIVAEFARNDKRIKLISQTNSGVSVARNRGISESKGKWITFVDGDDWIELNMCEIILNKLNDKKPDVAVWSYFKNFANKEVALSLLPTGDTIFENDKDVLLLKSINGNYANKTGAETVSAGTVWGKLYRREFIIKNKLDFNKELTRAQDTIFSINAFEKAKRIHYIDVSLYHYRITGTSTCSGSRYIEDTNKPFDALLNEFLCFINKVGVNEEYRNAFHSRVIQVIMWHLKHKYNNPLYKGGMLKKRREIISLIDSDPYQKALKYVRVQGLPKKERLLVHLFRMRLIISYIIILNTYEKISTKQKKKY